MDNPPVVTASGRSAQQSVQRQSQDHQQRGQRFAPADLRLPDFSVDKHDRDFAEPRALPFSRRSPASATR